MIRTIRRIWFRLFPPQPIRLPGKWPWVQPKPLARGTPLFNGVVSDGEGGVMPAGFDYTEMGWKRDKGGAWHPYRQPAAKRATRGEIG